MKCNNCGTELNEGEKFCAVCGQPVAAEQSGDTTQSVNAGQMAQAADGGQNPGKKPGFFGRKIIIAVAVVCVLALGVAAGAKVVNVLKKSNMSAAEFYQYAETKNRDAQLESLTEYYDSVYGGLAKESVGRKVNMKLTLSDTIKSMASLYGVDLSNVKNIEIDMAAKKEKDAYSAVIKAGGNDQELLTLKAYSDLSKMESYVQIPELSEAYIHTSADDLGEEGNRLLAITDFGKVIPDAEDLQKIYKRYTDIVIKSAKNVEKAEEQSECEAEGVSCKADLYTVTMEGKEAVSLAGDILKQLKEDNEIKDIITNIDEEAGAEYEEELAKAVEELDGSAEDISIIMEVQIDSNEKIIGRNIKIKDDTEEVAVRVMCPRDGENFGWEAVVEAEGAELFHLHGKGTEKDGVINGDFAADIAISSDEGALEPTKNVLMVAVEDYDVSNLKKGEVRGTITYSTEALAELANYSLKIEAEGNQKESTSTLSILAGKEAVATIDMKTESDVEIESTMPSESDKVYEASDSEAMSTYQSELNVLQLLQKVQDTLGIDFSSLTGLM